MRRGGIVFDATILGAGPPTGVARSFLDTLHVYARMFADDRPLGVIVPEGAESIDARLPDAVQRLVIPRSHARGFARLLALHRAARRFDAALLHSPVALVPPAIRGLGARWRLVATVHDLPWFATVPLSEPACGRRARIAARAAVRFADTVVVPSRATARDLATHTRLNADEAHRRIVVVPHGVCPLDPVSQPEANGADATPADTRTVAPSDTTSDTRIGTRTDTATGTPADTRTGAPSGTRTVAPADTPAIAPSGTPTGTRTIAPAGTPTGTRTIAPAGTPIGTRSITPAGPADAAGRYLLVLGDDRPRKNHATLRDAWQRAAARAPDLPPLRFVGPPDHFVDERTKWSLLRGAHALVHVSLHEGFGLPVVEAFRARTPVVCSRVASLPEIATPGSALLVDPSDVDSIADALVRVHEDAPLRRRVVQRGSWRALRWSLEAAARGWRDVHERLLD